MAVGRGDGAPASAAVARGGVPGLAGFLSGPTTARDVALGDLDRDDVDAFVVNFALSSAGGALSGEPDRIYLNDGAGGFVDSGQRLGSGFGSAAALGDVDRDGDDAFVVNFGHLDAGGALTPQPDEVWLNNGAGIFSDSGQRLGNDPGRAVALGDLDGDGDLDAFVANGADPNATPPGRPNKVWRNNGSGRYSDTGQRLGASDSAAVALGDVDGDGDADAVVGNDGAASEVWRNGGVGFFADSGQRSPSATSDVALGDVDGDRDLDIWFAMAADQGGGGAPQADQVYRSNGAGAFADTGQRLGAAATGAVRLIDLDGDGDLDGLAGNVAQPSEVWLNGGAGAFADSGQRLGRSATLGVGAADLDGDGDPDAVLANRGS
ncbi:MAG: FG-GAP-like repeat-containing protein [Anaerolineae bacterium]